MPEISQGRVERRPDGWYSTDADEFEPLLADVYHRSGFVDSYRGVLRRLDDLERRGAAQ